MLWDSVFEKHFKRNDFEGYVLTDPRRRTQALRRLAYRLVPNQRHGDYYLATFDEALDREEFDSALWWDLGGESYSGVLDSDSDEARLD